MNDLHDKRVLITGSTSGIGAAVAIGFASRGARVCVHGHSNTARGEEMVSAIAAEGGSAIFIPADLSQQDAPADLVTEAANSLGGLDVLINNAGGMPSRASVAEFDHGMYGHVMDVNLRAAFSTISAARPHMVAAGGGAIVNTSSASARTGGPGGSAIYAAAKAALHSLTRTAAKELAPDNIRVNSVIPGIIETSFHDGMPDDVRETLVKATPLGRLGRPEDCVGAFLFLASASMSGFITGQAIDVNGGLLTP
jgi:3-oxoacyl-[acyl-carrier protein] reductase